MTQVFRGSGCRVGAGLHLRDAWRVRPEAGSESWMALVRPFPSAGLCFPICRGGWEALWVPYGWNIVRSVASRYPNGMARARVVAPFPRWGKRGRVNSRGSPRVPGPLADLRNPVGQ